MNDEPDQVEGAVEEPQMSALCERLFKRHAQPIGIINVHQAEQHYERIVGWIAARYALLEQLLRRYRMDDLSGDGQPLVLEQSFWDRINAVPTPAPGDRLPSSTVPFPQTGQAIPLMHQSAWSEARPAMSLKPAAAPPEDASGESAPAASPTFRVSRRPPPTDIDPSDDRQGGGSAARQSTAVPDQPDAGQLKPAREVREAASTDANQPVSPPPQAPSSSFTAPEAGGAGQPPLSLELALPPPPPNDVSAPPPVDVAKSAATEPPTAKPLASAPEIRQKATEAAPSSASPQLELTLPSPPPNDVSAPPPVDAARPAGADHTAAAPLADVEVAEARQTAEPAPAAEPLAIAREIVGNAAEATRPADRLLLRDDSPAQQTSAPQSPTAAESDSATKHQPPAAAARNLLASQDDQQPMPLHTPADSASLPRAVEIQPATERAEGSGPDHHADAPGLARTVSSSQAEPGGSPLRAPAAAPDSAPLPRAVEIQPATGQAETGEPVHRAVTPGPARTAQKEASTALPRSPARLSTALPGGPPMAAEVQRPPLHSQPVDFIWRETDGAASETAARPGGSAPPAVNHSAGAAAMPSSSLPAQRAAQPVTPPQGAPDGFETIPDHVINHISQQVIRTLSRLLIVERERRGRH